MNSFFTSGIHGDFLQRFLLYLLISPGFGSRRVAKNAGSNAESFR